MQMNVEISTSLLGQTPSFLATRSSDPTGHIASGAQTGEFFRQTDLLIGNWSDLLPQIDHHVEPDVDYIDLISRLAATDSQMFQRIIDGLK
jgi:hypothetical protein